MTDKKKATAPLENSHPTEHEDHQGNHHTTHTKEHPEKHRETRHTEHKASHPPSHHADSKNHPPKKQPKKSEHASAKKTQSLLRKIGVIALCVLLVGVISLIVIKKISYIHEKDKLEAEAKKGPKVRVAEITLSEGDHVVMTTGEAEPYATVTLYAKVSGYLGDIYVDKGQMVKKGTLLATIESPETDQDYLGAKSDYINRTDVAKRMKYLIKRDLIAPQEYEQAQSDASMAKARYLAAATMKNYEKLVAPFDGRVTARYVDPGALIQSAQSGQTGALPVVTISQIDQLRTYAYVDQRDASFIGLDTPVTITLPEKPGYELPAHLTRIAGELDPKSRTMLVEIDIDNSKGEIVAGSFVNVSMQIHAPNVLQAPVDALVNIKNKTMVPVVTADKKVTYKEVKVSSNDGKNVGILSGVQVGDVVALNLGSNVAEGATVRPMQMEQQAQKENNSSKNGSGQKQGDGSSSPPTAPKVISTGGAVPAGDALSTQDLRKALNQGSARDEANPPAMESASAQRGKSQGNDAMDNTKRDNKNGDDRGGSKKSKKKDSDQDDDSGGNGGNSGSSGNSQTDSSKDKT